VIELNRYRDEVIRCHSNVANMPVSDAFPPKDIDATLKLLKNPSAATHQQF
jgi:transmembrane sensor